MPLGFVAGLTGKTADLGVGGRNGAQLAVENFNAAGGLAGRPVQLLVKDDESSPERAKQVLNELIAAQVPVTVGPMISAIATATVPLANNAGMALVSGTVTTNALSGLDDQFFRVISSTAEHAATMATYLHGKRQARRVSLLLNLGNRAYAESWAGDFAAAMQRLGGKIGTRVEYSGGEDSDFNALADQLCQDAPDAVILITNTVDAAHVARALAQRRCKALRATSEWAGTGKLAELGGSAVEGFIVPQYLDLDSRTPAWLAFREQYQKRFQQSPGYPAVLTYNATQTALRALAERRGDESVKQALLRLRQFDGLQSPFSLDANGDVRLPTYLTEIRAGSYTSINGN